MLLLHQTGAVKVGEVVRYTVTYTPSLDRILPPPSHLHVRIKNTSAIPLRAAYLHGPYTLYVSCYPSTFDPYVKYERYKEEGAPDYEPQLKAGGHWGTKLTVPEEIRQGASEGERNDDGERKSFTWIIEVASQVLFSTSASVHFEVLVGRDEKSIQLGLNGIVQGHTQGLPGKLEDHQQARTRNNAQPKGVYSKAVRLGVDDTESLWNTPAFPEWDQEGDVSVGQGPQHGDMRDGDTKGDKKSEKQKKIHLVVLTHGLHSNLGADMLFMKECIDTASKQAAKDAKQRKAELRAQQAQENNDFGREAVNQRSKSAPELPAGGLDGDDEEDEEQVLVRGFNGNAVKTEKGIQYLGKRLAKFVLSMTYPDQPYLPVKSSISKTITRTLTGSSKIPQADGIEPTHKNSSIVKDEKHLNHNLPYRITSISFISHSLGGLVQTYAVAYIQKHSPEFFDRIQPINFVAMASPFLGLSNENPIYVKFALDFGLVGRTGQDLGLTWRAPTIARSGWGAMMGGLVNDSQKDKTPDPGTKPLLRILPTGPAHVALKRFRNRTVYSNVVNDGIVPLRTSCLLFLDWRGLGRVEKARRDNGLVGTMVNWGFSELIGQNASAPRKGIPWNDFFGDSGDEATSQDKSSVDPAATVPQADASQGFDDVRRSSRADDGPSTGSQMSKSSTQQDRSDSPNIWATLTSFFKPQSSSTSQQTLPKNQKIYRRGQTTLLDSQETEAESTSPQHSKNNSVSSRGGLVRGSSLYTNNSDNENLEAPPRTTFFESAGDLLNPPLPPQEFLLDPAARPRTIFHDRVYHPDDIPPPPSKRQRTAVRRSLSKDDVVSNQTNSDLSKRSTSTTPIEGTMKIEEKIARAYHKDMSWRKVLVRLEPDAHNNMIVRRMFANAYGWPVVKHLCDTHFAYTAAAQTRDEDEPAIERAKGQDEAVDSQGEQVKGQVDPPSDDRALHNLKEGVKDDINITPQYPPRVSSRNPQKDAIYLDHRTLSEARESRDHVSDLVSMVSAQGEPSTNISSMHSGTAALNRLARQDSARWSDQFFEGSEDESEDGDGDLAKELQKAQGRGQGMPARAGTLPHHVEVGLSPDNTRIGRSTTTSKRLESPIKTPILPSPERSFVQEPEEDPDLPSPALEDLNIGSVHALSPTTTNELGLGKKAPEIVMDSPRASNETNYHRRTSVDMSVTERVAVAQNQGQQLGHDQNG